MANNAPQDDVIEDESADSSGAASVIHDDTHRIYLNKDIQIDDTHPLPHLDKASIKAYKAKGSNKFASDLFALVCDKALTPRRLTSIKYSKVINLNFVKLVASGKVLWAPDKEEKFCFVFENSLGQPVLGRNEKNASLGWRPEDVTARIVHPMIRILQDLHNKDIVHGEIWPGNMYYSKQAGSEIIHLGECLSGPPSYFLPALYEPVERAIADPIGRGTGTLSDDLYSFGVTLAVFLRSNDPLSGLDADQIIERKIEKGSYATLIGGERLSGGLLELLRGLLYDDPAQRWTLEDVQAWVDGRRLSPKQSTRRVKASRPLLLHTKKYVRPEVLAKNMGNHVDEANKLIENGELAQWIDRAIEDKIVKARFEQFMKEMAAHESGVRNNDEICALVASALYPDCPVRYMGVNFIPSGFGRYLSYAYMNKRDLKPFVDSLKQGFIIKSLQVRKHAQALSLITKFDSCRAFITQSAVGSGLERCIYFLNPECHCLSSILEKYHVLTPEEMMDAFESICSSALPRVLFDRHVVAFLSVKDRKNIDPYIADIRSEDKHRYILGVIRTLATIQKRSDLGKFPALAGWAAENLTPLYERFHDAEKRESVKKYIHSIKKEGDLTKIAVIFDDPTLYQGDISSFHKAMREYRKIDDEKNFIEESLESKSDFGHSVGRQVASVVSTLISLIIILLTLLNHL